MSLDHLTLHLRQRMRLSVETPGGVELEAWVEAIDAARNRLTLRLSHPSPPVSPGDPIRISFGFEGQRWVSTTNLHHYPDRSTYVLNLPRPFVAGDRRAHPRWFPDHPLGWVEVRVSLGEGLVLKGPLASLSESGLSLVVKQIQGIDGPVAWRTGLLEAGQMFEALTLAGVEELPDLEAEGLLAWVERVKGDLRMGLRLRGMREAARESLRAFLMPRLQPPPTELPPVSAEALAAPPVDAAPASPRNQALLRLKKRSRNLAVAMLPGPARDELETFLEGDGYSHVWRVDSIPQWLELLAERSLDLVFIDGGFKELRDLELASFLHQSRGEQSFAIAAALPTLGTSYGLLMRKAGVSRLISKPYVLDAAFAQELEAALDLH